MYKKNLINLCAVTIAMSMAFAPAVTVYAEGTQYPTTTETWQENTGKTTIHNGDVINDGSQNSTVYAEGEGTLVVENGNSLNVNDSWRTISSHTNGTAVLNGNGEGASGAGAFVNGTTVVSGDITARSGAGLNATGDSYLIDGGDVSAKTSGIITDGTSTIIVNGDVNANTTGIKVTVTQNTQTGKTHICGCGDNCGAGDNCSCPDRVDVTSDGNNKNLIVVEGTVDAPTGVSVELNSAKDDQGNALYQLSTDDLPTIVVYELANDTIVAKTTDENGQIVEDSSLEEYLRNNIQYIVKNNSTGIITVNDGLKQTTVTKISYDKNANKSTVQEALLTTTLQNAFTVAVNAGYELTAGSNAEITPNKDGTYTIRLTNSKGGITLSARLINVSTPAQAPTADSSYEENQSSEETFEPFIFATFTVTNSSLPDVLGASRDGGMATEVVAYESRPVVKIASGPLTAFEYKETFIRTMKEAPKNAIVRLETSIPSCFDKMMMEALAERSDILLEVVFPVNGEKVTATVPAGYDVMSLLDENGYCGFLNLLAVFGNSAQ